MSTGTRQEIGKAARVVCWFSCGDASAVATAFALNKYRGKREVVVARIVIPSEHEDNERFSNDCEVWFGQPIVRLASTEYKDPWDVWEKRRYIAGIKGAPCTTELKKVVRFGFQRADDLHIFGYSVEEWQRAKDFREGNPEIDLECPLIQNELTKTDCHSLVRAQGIELPIMYRLGFNNNNCIGCPKGGAGYWNLIRVHFPDVFVRMSKLSRELNVRLIKLDRERMFLDELPLDAGRHKDEVIGDCSPFCASAAKSLEAA